jgi:glycine cleavage system transcriptional repressor
VTHYAVTAIGRDRPGIAAAISKVLLDVGGNIEDSQMSILRGHFAVMLIVSVPEQVDSAELQTGMKKVQAELELEAIAVNQIDELAGGGEPTHLLSVYGADHPGIVYEVSKALADRGVNITDLQTRLAGGGDAPVYVMLMEVVVSGNVNELDSALREVATEAGLDVTLRELEAEAL